MAIATGETRAVAIATGESLSDEIDVEGFTGVFAIVMPAAWTTADLTFQAAAETGGTFQDVYDDAGTEVTVSVDAAQVVGVNKPALAPFRCVKVCSGTADTPVTQDADRARTLLAE